LSDDVASIIDVAVVLGPNILCGVFGVKPFATLTVIVATVWWDQMLGDMMRWISN